MQVWGVQQNETGDWCQTHDPISLEVKVPWAGLPHEVSTLIPLPGSASLDWACFPGLCMSQTSPERSCEVIAVRIAKGGRLVEA